MNKKDFIQIADKYALKMANAAEAKIIETFFDQSIVSSIAEVENEKQVGSKIRNKIGKQINAKQPKFFSIQNRYMQYAAILLFPIMFSALMATLYLNEYWAQEIVYATARGEQKEFVLPDGSKVTLNNESRLSYMTNFKQQRALKLDGEAFFEVIRNEEHPFTVESHEIITTVLGTSFNIKSYEGENSYVTVNTGKVKVNPYATPDKKVYLQANEQARFLLQSKTLIKQKVETSDYLVWREKTIRFDKMPLSEVMHVLGRWYDVEIRLNNLALKNCIISGKYKEDDLKNVLEGIRFMIDIEYKFTTSNSILIDGRGCR